MGLADDVLSLAERIHSDLDVAFEYYVNSRRAWRLVHQMVSGGEHFSILNRATETVADEKTVLALSRRYVAVNLASSSLEKFVALLEDYLISLHRLWLEMYPGKLSGSQMRFDEIAGLPDKPAIIRRFIDKELQNFAYKQPEKWFLDFNDFAKLNCPTNWGDRQDLRDQSYT
ncbi:MAG: hypothetical protein JWN86_2894 [Planctomycetota bacterium]|nr:hypothetical protein [Planctomycetota bacterium]